MLHEMIKVEQRGLREYDSALIRVVGSARGELFFFLIQVKDQAITLLPAAMKSQIRFQCGWRGEG